MHLILCATFFSHKWILSGQPTDMPKKPTTLEVSWYLVLITYPLSMSIWAVCCSRVKLGGVFSKWHSGPKMSLSSRIGSDVIRTRKFFREIEARKRRQKAKGFEDSTRGNLEFIFFDYTLNWIVWTIERVLYHLLVRKGTVRHLIDRDVCQVPCRSTSSFLSDTFFRPAYTLTHWSSEDGTAVWGVLGVLSSWG